MALGQPLQCARIPEYDLEVIHRDSLKIGHLETQTQVPRKLMLGLPLAYDLSWLSIEELTSSSG